VWDTGTLDHSLFIPTTVHGVDGGGAAGQERFDCIGRAFYRNANVCILVYDITNLHSLERLDHWKRTYEEGMPEQADIDRTVFGVFATKVLYRFELSSVVDVADDAEDDRVQTDLEGQRKVSQAKAEAWCRENGDMPHFSVSAKYGDGVEQAFNTLAKKAKGILDEWYRPTTPTRHPSAHQTSKPIV
jgi:GTPase SAR1 family protein